MLNKFGVMEDCQWFVLFLPSPGSGTDVLVGIHLLHIVGTSCTLSNDNWNKKWCYSSHICQSMRMVVKQKPCRAPYIWGALVGAFISYSSCPSLLYPLLLTLHKIVVTHKCILISQDVASLFCFLYHITCMYPKGQLCFKRASTPMTSPSQVWEGWLVESVECRQD